MQRIVKMKFREDAVEDFLRIFDDVKEKIRASEGCEHLELLRDQHSPNIFFTYSTWQSPEYLEQYRHSDLFQTTWKKTKALFKDRAAAWSVDRIHHS